MRAGQHIVANSTLLTGIAWDHLINPSGEGGGGDVIINSEIKNIVILLPVGIRIIDTSVNIAQHGVVNITRVIENVDIIVKKGDEINVVC